MRLPGLKIVRAKGGVYVYWRATGYRFHAALGTPEFLQEYAALTKGDEAPAVRAGSLDALIVAYRKAPEFRTLAPRTRADYEKQLTLIGDTLGRFAVASIQRKHVIELRDTYQETPRKADYVVQVLSLLFSFACERGLRNDNPALRVKKFGTIKGYTPWSEAEYAKFMKDGDATLADAVCFGRFTGQRIGDCIKANWSDCDGGVIHVRQNKTGTKLVIPMHRDLRARLEAMQKRSTRILTTKNGRPWTYHHLARELREELIRLGLGHLSFHGLRKLAGASLVDAGADAKDVQAILGHQDIRQSEEYVASADQKRRAVAAILKLERNGKRFGKPVGKPRQKD
jgi:integrase